MLPVQSGGPGQLGLAGDEGFDPAVGFGRERGAGGVDDSEGDAGDGVADDRPGSL